MTTQSTEQSAAQNRLCAMVASTFFLRTMPQ